MTASDLTLRVVMVSGDITDDIDAGLELGAEPTVILQGSIEAVKAAAQLFGEQVAITRAPLDGAVNALVEAVSRYEKLTRTQMRTADYHGEGCKCIRCAEDAMFAALRGIGGEP